ncbi:uncharacterized protein N7477_004952 [Penicillium maclennaniae]|uniref:uncharacterized protein n=1 Tax=Penicillium maclennaniae TaxID=1343394 RepID=UPI0025419259|nr:uncharacterized protein N7477_004952 [Penicillium maclennaniae]KAJ5675018.1 hypothetical protein N7477_004952 [Penicillium maclennaniae]
MDHGNGKDNGSSCSTQDAFDHKRMFVLPQGNHLLSLMTVLRDANTKSTLFVETTERVGDKLIAAAERTAVISPTGSKYQGIQHTVPVCGVSILRAGASLENAMRRGYTGPLTFGKVLIQRDEKTCEPTLFYSKFPPNISSQWAMILEPMLATGGSACAAIDVIKAQGVPEENIIFVNVLASRHGAKTLLSRFPQIRLVTAAIDEDMTLSNHIDPGLGDFGDRFYGTNDS